MNRSFRILYTEDYKFLVEKKMLGELLCEPKSSSENAASRQRSSEITTLDAPVSV